MSEENVQNGLSTIQQLINTVMEFFVNYSFQVLGAIIVLIIGMVAGNWVNKTLLRMFEKKKMDVTLARFIASIGRISVLVFAFIIALGKFGITIAPFIAALSAMAFGASIAIQGPLSNYGAGLSIILSRPFIVGDTISVAGMSGVVQEVKLACTVLVDEDGVKITIPNKQIVGEIVQNSRANKAAEGVIGISYSDDPAKAVSVIQKTLGQLPGVIQNPAPQVGVQAFADSSVNMGFRYWVSTVKYFQTVYAVNLAVYKAIQQAGISIPFPQREVRVVSQPEKAKEGTMSVS